MTEDDEAAPKESTGSVTTSGIDAGIVSGLFLIVFVIRAEIFQNMGYVVGGLTVDAILFAIGYQVAKRHTTSIRDFRIIYIALFSILILSHFSLKH